MTASEMILTIISVALSVTAVALAQTLWYQYVTLPDKDVTEPFGDLYDYWPYP